MLVSPAPGSVKKNILLTGRPGTGKTTFIRKVVKDLADLHPAGFYTGEIRTGGERQGFSLAGLDGTAATLARVGIESPYRVGKYGVDLPGFEAFLRTMPPPETARGLVIIDEIGKMECLSPLFRSLVSGYLDSPRLHLVATIAQKGDGFIGEIKARSDVALYELTLRNRGSLPGVVADAVRAVAGH